MLDVKLATTAAERDECYLLRIEVFVRGQNVPLSMELDDDDEVNALHFLGYDEGKPVATARVLLRDSVAKIQRVAVLERCRGRGFGVNIMRWIMDHLRNNGLAEIAVLDAQTHALEFYGRLGFIAEGDEFDDAGILHRRMSRAV